MNWNSNPGLSPKTTPRSQTVPSLWAGKYLPPQTGSSPGCTASPIRLDGGTLQSGQPLPSDWGLPRVDSLSHQMGLGVPWGGQPLPSDCGLLKVDHISHQTEGFLTTRSEQLLPSFVPGLSGVGKPALHRSSTLPNPSLDTPHTW